MTNRRLLTGPIDLSLLNEVDTYVRGRSRDTADARGLLVQLLAQRADVRFADVMLSSVVRVEPTNDARLWAGTRTLDHDR
jgi:hypothetical protein